MILIIPFYPASHLVEIWLKAVSFEDRLRVVVLEKLGESSLDNLLVLITTHSFDKYVFNSYHVQDSVAGSMDETKECMKCVSI